MINLATDYLNLKSMDCQNNSLIWLAKQEKVATTANIIEYIMYNMFMYILNKLVYIYTTQISFAIHV